MALHDEQIQAVVDYWDGQLIPDAHRLQFRAALRGVLAQAPEGLSHGIAFVVNFDARFALLAAVRDAGIGCRGTMYSASELFRCREADMRVYHDRVMLAEGHAAPFVQIWPTIDS